jgi:hypothetical protein
MFKKILDIIKSLKLNNKQLVAFLALSILVITGMGTYILNQKPEVKPVDNTLQIELKTISSEFYRFKKYEIEEISLLKRSHEIDLNNLQKEFDAKVLLLADNLQASESKRVKDMLDFAESVKSKESRSVPEKIYTEKGISIFLKSSESIEQPIPIYIEDTITFEPCANELLVKDTLIKKSLFKKFIGIFNKDTLK